jgi:hypothetical protein
VGGVKFARALELAQRHVSPTTPITELRGMLEEQLMVSEWVADTLAEAQPCGLEAPPIVPLGNGTCGVLVDDRGDALTVSEARAYAAMILRAADAAEEQNG